MVFASLGEGVSLAISQEPDISIDQQMEVEVQERFTPGYGYGCNVVISTGLRAYDRLLLYPD